MYNFREYCEINLTTWHTVACFNPWLFTVSVKSKVGLGESARKGKIVTILIFSDIE